MSDAHLRHLLGQLPPDAQVPAGWVLEHLDGAAEDLTLDQVAEKVGRAVSTVRGWANSGELEGAYRLRGREWKIPAVTLQRFLEGERSGEGKSLVRARGPVNLSSWRKHRPEAGEGAA